MAQNCPCGNNHQAYVRVNGVDFAVNVLATDQPRDVTWLSWPGNLTAPQALARNVELNPPAPGELVVVFSAHGNFLHRVDGLPPRDPGPGSPPELQLRPAPLTGADQQTLDRIFQLSFERGQSGSPVVKLNNTVVGVVRNNEGRCGLVQL